MTELQKLIDAKYRQLNSAIAEASEADLIWQEIYALQEIQSQLESLQKFKEAAETRGVNFT